MSGRNRDPDDSFVQLARYVGEGKVRDATALIRRELPAIGRDRPDLGEAIRRALAGVGAGALARAVSVNEVPSDRDTKLDLLREESVPSCAEEPIWPEAIDAALRNIVLERTKLAELESAGVSPTRTLLFVGAPGVGKTLAARWLARELQRPLITLDLATVMSSFLGRTGNNIRAVLDYAQKRNALLLLDEFDAIAKRRDDSSDVGELKRLVTVLLQAIDDWPAKGLLVCATNHPELLDPAVWRRFEHVIEFPMASAADAKKIVHRALGDSIDGSLLTVAASAFAGHGFADAVRELTGAKRDAITQGITVQIALEDRIRRLVQVMPRPERLRLADRLATVKVSQRRIREITGIARDTLRTRGIAVANKSAQQSKTKTA
ncbi:ATP-dependent zinc metalloprotease FtsH [Burkholderia multivorans]|nr:ATP-dependent zinc metalloprotease FtsH [Burkholderia multivorans]MDR8775290.1 ATP-dependent zinc metalloprotease FtsH [Burkholderia multivorans]MDR8793578.1 ATP-dependent zinc metalloprotease FtsH [Burkholderia multivorans]MDR8796245.1 ATP-dependent zinc metalloprotease FtsH [Burkholderia multivorans]MDR8803352.1 ATP-dependent zinc metalloprotease FtsH [Burkholderia multivorans]